MISRLLGYFKKIAYTIRYMGAVSISGCPKNVMHMQLYVHSGKVSIGKNFTMKPGVYIAAVNGGSISIGDNVSLNRNCILVCHDSILIADNCAVGPNTIFYDHDHKFDETGIQPGFKTAPIIIEKNCWIGAGVTILRGTLVGEGSIIGAGSIIHGEIPPHSLVTSNREMNISPIRTKEPQK